ncbi:phosphatidate cytidylyltransferase mitochondrial [Biomphalaria pfeifferi]|uniref:Phosphatidate cytidylyltransferase, mitochondrial n=1 Tax=Biomphalaria pfeifferi TaxID=112525 RepID=A0AAD8F0A6_BIOPF|nr:phosphatidate cytidylyltransferase mitochondrial [Biomphalaria pfeifferi]
MGIIRFYQKLFISTSKFNGTFSVLKHFHFHHVNWYPSSCALTSHIPKTSLLQGKTFHDSCVKSLICKPKKRLLSTVKPQGVSEAAHIDVTLPKDSISIGNTLKETSSSKDKDFQKELYNKIVDSFPEGIQMAFAYGSGVIKQQNSADISKNMLDFIFVVDKPMKWHRLNLERHPNHYSFLRRLGPQTITRIQERYGAGVYFNTLVPMHGRLIKYGVISTARLITDLLDWESLYVSGRLHKPVTLIVVPTNEQLLTAMKVNLNSAVHAALLMLPDMFTEEQLYLTIASLSYAGDFRMGIAEDKNKINNIVKPSISLFRKMYGPLLMEEEHVTWWQAEGQLEQALTFHSRHHHLKCLPGQVLYGLLIHKFQIGVFPDLEDIIKRHAYDSECGKHVANSIKQIVKKSSVMQTMKGILTAGFTKSLRYAANKVMKKIKSI